MSRIEKKEVEKLWVGIEAEADQNGCVTTIRDGRDPERVQQLEPCLGGIAGQRP